MTEDRKSQARARFRAGTAVSAVLALLIPLGALLYALDVPRSLGFIIYREQLLAFALAAAIALTFIDHRAFGEPRAVPWYDWGLAALGLTTGVYVAATYQDIAFEMAYRPADLVAVGAILVLLLIEAIRRAAGIGLMAIVVFFILFAATGDLLGGPLAAQKVATDRLAIYLAFDPNALLGLPLMIAVIVVSLFVLFGQLLTRAGGTLFFTDLASALMGRYRGGSAKIAVVGSAFFGSVSGSAVANVVATGVVTIPIMTKSGFRRRQAAAIEAVASTGGQLAPPIMGAAAFLMAEFMQVPYGEIILAAVIPAVFYYASLFIAVDLNAAKSGISGLPGRDLPITTEVLKRGWFFGLPFAVLLGSLFYLNETPDRSVAYACGAVLVFGMLLGYGTDRLNARALPDLLVEAGRSAKSIIVICAGAGLVIGAINVSGVGFGLTMELVRIGETSLGLLLFVAAILCIVLGMGMPSTGVYVLLAALVVPGLIRLGIDPFAANMFIFYFGMLSMITPPIALAAFAAASLVDSRPMRTAVDAVKLGWVAYIVPFLFVYSPALVMQAGIGEALIGFTTGMIGVTLVTMAMCGYSLRPLSRPGRAWYAVAGGLLMLHFSDIGLLLAVQGAGLLLGATLLTIDWRRRAGPAAAPTT